VPEPTRCQYAKNPVLVSREPKCGNGSGRAVHNNHTGVGALN
jgi:hypothetical protein